LIYEKKREKIRYRKKQARDLSSLTLAWGRSGERFSLVFFVPDLRRSIREGEISCFFLGKGKKSIDLESVVCPAGTSWAQSLPRPSCGTYGFR
jgi:hypothetical protein